MSSAADEREQIAARIGDRDRWRVNLFLMTCVSAQSCFVRAEPLCIATCSVFSLLISYCGSFSVA
jgi:hypothetical protein